MKYPDKKVWIQKSILKNYIYNAIKDFGLPYVLYCIEEGITHNACSTEEWAKEFEKVDLFSEKHPRKQNNNYTGKLSISQLAEIKYNVLSDKEGRCACPIHLGKNKTSFKFDDDKNLFNCFSCGVKGNLIHFIKLMEEKYERGRKTSI